MYDSKHMYQVVINDLIDSAVVLGENQSLPKAQIRAEYEAQEIFQSPLYSKSSKRYLLQNMKIVDKDTRECVTPESSEIFITSLLEAL